MGLLPSSESDVASMRASGITSIIPDPEADTAAWQTGPSIVAGPELQVKHLANLGRSGIGFAAPGDSRLTSIVEARLAVVRETVAKLGLGEVDHRLINVHDASSQSAVHEWSSNGITGVVAYNDEIAAAVVGAALREGLSVPDELAVIGHDDNPWAELFVPSLSSIRMDIEGLPRAAQSPGIVGPIRR
jgi:DNA-binding LacI/PurR family transcriptional regulator